MPIQQLIPPQQNNLLDTFLQAEQLRNYRSANALAEAKAAELPYERERLQALNMAKVGKETALTDKARAEIGFQTAEWVLRDPANKPAVIGALRHGAQWVPAMGQVADHLETLEGPAFAETAGGLAMSVKDKAAQALNERKETRAQANTDSQIAYRDSMLGQPMVIQAPGGAYTYPRDNPQDLTRMDTGPSQIEVDEAKRQQPTPKIAAQNRDRLQTIAVLEQQLAKVQAAFKGIENSTQPARAGATSRPRRDVPSMRRSMVFGPSYARFRGRRARAPCRITRPSKPSRCCPRATNTKTSPRRRSSRSRTW